MCMRVYVCACVCVCVFCVFVQVCAFVVVTAVVVVVCVCACVSFVRARLVRYVVCLVVCFPLCLVSSPFFFGVLSWNVLSCVALRGSCCFTNSCWIFQRFCLIFVLQGITFGPIFCQKWWTGRLGTQKAPMVAGFFSGSWKKALLQRLFWRVKGSFGAVWGVPGISFDAFWSPLAANSSKKWSKITFLSPLFVKSPFRYNF